MNSVIINFFEDVFLEIFWNSANNKIFEINLKSNCRELYVENLPGSVKYAIDYFKDYYKKPGRKYDLNYLDFSILTEFQKKTYLALYNIPFGKTVTYKQLAILIGNQGAARAIGNAMKRNPFPVIIPCHRVLAKKHIGGFSSGVNLKKKLIEKELNI